MPSETERAVEDYSHLPETAWVHILKYLSLTDRASVALTCHALNDVFRHPSLWYHSKIVIQAGTRNLRHSTIMISRRQVELIKRFGKYFQNLELVFMGYISEIPDNVLEILKVLHENCRYETLTLTIGTTLSKREFYWESPESFNLEPLMTLIENAYRLKHLNILAYQIHRHIYSPNILEVIRRNSKNQRLSSLNLFYKTAEETSWSTLNANLPSPDETVKTVHFCKELTVLKLQSTMLSTELIVELSKPDRVPLERLSILVTYSRQDRTPNIASADWQTLVKACPDLAVEFTFVTRMPALEKSLLLKPEIPVESLSFMRYSECTREDLLSITDKYRQTLIKFIDFSQGSQGTDKEISKLVHTCHKVDYLIYTGAMNQHTVVDLARSRGERWRVFQVDSSQVTTTDAEERDADDNDQVLVRAADGSYQMAWQARHQDELERQARLEVMIQEVGVHLGRRWLPSDIREDRAEELMARLYAQQAV